MKYITVKLTENQTGTIIEALSEWSKAVNFDRRPFTDEEKAHNAYIDRIISTLAKAKISSEA